MLKAKPQFVKEWQDARFGMFVCWGPVSLTGLEIGWSRGAPRGRDESTRWGCAPNSASGWRAVDLGEPMTFRRVVILEGPRNRVRKLQLQYKEGNDWKSFHEGTTLGVFIKSFENIAAQKVRLNIIEAANAPSIWEFQLLAPGESKE